MLVVVVAAGWPVDMVVEAQEVTREAAMLVAAEVVAAAAAPVVQVVVMVEVEVLAAMVAEVVLAVQAGSCRCSSRGMARHLPGSSLTRKRFVLSADLAFAWQGEV